MSSANDVEVKTVSGDLWLRGDSKDADVRAEHGERRPCGRARRGRGRCDHRERRHDARSAAGALGAHAHHLRQRRVPRQARDGRELEAETVSGDLNVRLPAEAGFDYELSSFSGDIENCFNVEAEKTSRYGPGSRLSGKRGEGGGEVRMNTMSGDD